MSTGTEHAPDRLLWLDLEFTGLNIEDDVVIEAGAIVTNAALDELATYQTFINYPRVHVLPLLSRNPWWQERPEHQAVMLDGIKSATKSVETVGTELAEFAAEWCPSPITLAGNSIHNDRRWVRRDFSQLEKRLNYRMLDVSSLGILAENVLGIRFEGKAESHRVLDDLRDSHAQLRFLMKAMGNEAVVNFFS